MKITIISDTHGDHQTLGILSGDILIHCGDFEHLFKSDSKAVEKMDNWFGRQQFEHIICTGGNHDLTVEAMVNAGKQPFRNAIFLNGAALSIEGINFFGAPWVPKLEGHAFFADDHKLQFAWNKIPENVDVLITHTPPKGILDVSSRGLVLGCSHLRKRLNTVKPSLHCFGHVHASAGVEEDEDTIYLNASSVNHGFKVAFPPFEFEATRLGDGSLQIVQKS